MLEFLIIASIVLLLAVMSSKLLYRFGVPALLIFLVLGMLFGSDGIVGYEFSNYEFARKVCSIGLIFIMFYGGFGTNWKMAKPVAVKATLMSTLGVVITAATTGFFCVWVLKASLLEGLLIGSVLASTDAASVFAVLRSRKLNLKGGLASLLEIESGSNDPFAYMLTIGILTLMSGEPQSLFKMVILQIVLGIVFGIVLAFGTSFILRRVHIEIDGLYPVLVVAVTVLGYSLSEFLGGNGYLCVYIIGIILGNSKIYHKKSLVHFFDGISWLMQIVLFFVLGLLAFPSQLPKVIVPGILISIFMIVIARPVATFAILSWFKVPLKQQLLVSWVGLRGAASIVFAIYAVTSQSVVMNDIFHIVFMVALLSVSLQGSLIPFVAKKLNLVEKDVSVFKTFNDYQDDASSKLIEVDVDEDNPWANLSLIEADIPEEILVVMIKRQEEVVVPKGSTVILPHDVLVLSGNNFEELLEKHRKKVGKS